jgi:archaellum component FlaC
MFLKKLAGRTDIENALQRLENMTLEETRMTGAESLRAIHGIGNEVSDKMHGVQDALQAFQDKVGGVEGMLQGVTDMLQGVDDKVQGVDVRVKDIGDKVINSAQTVQLAISTALIVYMVRC